MCLPVQSERQALLCGWACAALTLVRLGLYFTWNTPAGLPPVRSGSWVAQWLYAWLRMLGASAQAWAEWRGMLGSATAFVLLWEQAATVVICPSIAMRHETSQMPHTVVCVCATRPCTRWAPGQLRSSAHAPLPLIPWQLFHNAFSRGWGLLGDLLISAVEVVRSGRGGLALDACPQREVRHALLLNGWESGMLWCAHRGAQSTEQR